MSRLVPSALLILLSASPLLADDARARRYLEKAQENWDDSEPSSVLSLLERALKARPQSLSLRKLILLNKARLLVARMGDPVRGERVYDEVIQGILTRERRARAGSLLKKICAAPLSAQATGWLEELAETSRLLEIKADAMVGKANLVYAERDEVQRALKIYLGANLAWLRASTSDVGSQFCYRVARDTRRPPELRRLFLDRALSFSRAALRGASDEFGGEELAQQLARYRLQLAIVLHGRGAEAEAARLWAEVDPEQLTLATLYQQAILRAQRGETAEATDSLRRFLLETRPTPAARNDLRKFIRSEPDFQPHLRRADWSDLVSDEPTHD